MSREVEDDEAAEELSPWEEAAVQTLASKGLPRWDHKAKAATFALGHRGLLDLDLDFPEAHLRGPALLCYVWKRDVQGASRVHCYIDVDGRCFQVRWQEEARGSKAGQPPVHEVGLCSEPDCAACTAAAEFREYQRSSEESADETGDDAI